MRKIDRIKVLESELDRINEQLDELLRCVELLEKYGFDYEAVMEKYNDILLNEWTKVFDRWAELTGYGKNEIEVKPENIEEYV